MIALLVLGIVGFTNPDVIYEYASSAWNSSNETTIHTIQEKLNCCGFNTTTDRPALPCPENATEPCQAAMVDFLTDNLKILAGVGFTIVALMLFAIIFAIIVACKGV